MHPKVCLHQIGFLSEPTPAFIEFCRDIGVQHMTLANPRMLGPTVLDDTLAALAQGRTSATNMAQPFARYPDLDADDGGAAEVLIQAIDAAAGLGMPHVYLISGGRGSLDWEEAAARFAQLLIPCRDHAATRGVALSVETTSPLYADIHIAHTLDDTIRLAEIAGIGITLDLGACWFEGGLADKFRRALPATRLVQVSDYVLGDRSIPCRAVPGDGVVPLERLVGRLLDLGYEGLFDLELTGPRIETEGHRAALHRAAEALSEMLTRLGA